MLRLLVKQLLVVAVHVSYNLLLDAYNPLLVAFVVVVLYRLLFRDTDSFVADHPGLVAFLMFGLVLFRLYLYLRGLLGSLINSIVLICVDHLLTLFRSTYFTVFRTKSVGVVTTILLLICFLLNA